LNRVGRGGRKGVPRCAARQYVNLKSGNQYSDAVQGPRRTAARASSAMDLELHLASSEV